MKPVVVLAVAAFGEEKQCSLMTTAPRRPIYGPTNFVGPRGSIDAEEITVSDKPGLVLAELPSGSPVRTTVQFVDLLERHDAVTSVFDQGDLLAKDVNLGWSIWHLKSYGERVNACRIHPSRRVCEIGLTRSEAVVSHLDTRSVRLTMPSTVVTDEFRRELFQEANRAGVSSAEFLLRAAAEKLLERGRPLSGIFAPGDVQEVSL